MAFYGKEYKLDRDENYEEFLRVIELPEDNIKATLAFKPTQTIVNNGDTYTVTAKTPRGEKVKTFKSGVPFESTVGEGKPTKNVITVEDNIVTEVLTSDKGTTTFKKEYNGDDLIVTVTNDRWNGVGRRYYKA